MRVVESLNDAINEHHCDVSKETRDQTEPASQSGGIRSTPGHAARPTHPATTNTPSRRRRRQSMARPVRTSVSLEEDELKKRGYYIGAALGEGSYAKVIKRRRAALFNAGVYISTIFSLIKLFYVN